MSTEACLVAVTLVLAEAGPALPARDVPGPGYVDRAEVVLVRPAPLADGRGASALSLRSGASVYVRETPAAFVAAECVSVGAGLPDDEPPTSP